MAEVDRQLPYRLTGGIKPPRHSSVHRVRRHDHDTWLAVGKSPLALLAAALSISPQRNVNSHDRFDLGVHANHSGALCISSHSARIGR